MKYATSFNPTGQLTIDFHNESGDVLTKLTSLAEAEAAIDLIKEQGEGNSSSPATGPDSPELAHYYRFLQIKDGRKYVQQPDGTFKQDPSQPLPFPTAAEIYLMAPVPAGGYSGVPESDAFDAACTRVVQLLHDAWNQGDSDILDNAVIAMYCLGSPKSSDEPLVDRLNQQAVRSARSLSIFQYALFTSTSVMCPGSSDTFRNSTHW